MKGYSIIEYLSHRQDNADEKSHSNFHLFRAPDGKSFLFEAGSGLFFLN